MRVGWFVGRSECATPLKYQRERVSADGSLAMSKAIEQIVSADVSSAISRRSRP